MNKVILLGRLTKDPELKQTQGGISVCRFTVAVDRRFQKQGKRGGPAAAADAVGRRRSNETNEPASAERGGGRSEVGSDVQADFIGCVAWRQQAEFIAKYFAKGHRICCEGSIQTRSWTDDNGKKQYATDVIIDHAEFAQSKSEGQGYQPVGTPPPMGGTGDFRQGQIDTYAGTVMGCPPILDDDMPW